ncbi:MAG: hypothetical protein H3Z51_10470, partial [archaeon]|nr:hypothetical protein [archaeon]
IKREIRDGKKRLDELAPFMDKAGERIETERNLMEIDAETNHRCSHSIPWSHT